MLKLRRSDSSNVDGLGRRTSTTVNASATTHGYDAISRPVTDTHTFSSGPGNMADTLGYNPASQIVSEQRSDDSYVWTGGVALTRAYAVNGLNQYTTAGPAAFSYDANGNLTSDGSNAYVYDAENRLVSANASGGVTLAYDPMGRLWQTSSGAYGTTQFVYEGDHVAMEYNGSNAVLRRFAWGPGVDEPILQDEGGALDCTGTRFLHADHQGSIIAAAGCSGTRLSVNTYDEYGIGGAANWGRLQYTGQAWIPDLGIYYYKARMYSPTLGRFLQTDPIGYKDDFNLYAYVGNDPINGTDPSGLEGNTCSLTGRGSSCSGDYGDTVSGKLKPDSGTKKVSGMLSRVSGAIANNPKTAIGVGIGAVGVGAACVFGGCEALGIIAAGAEAGELLALGVETSESVLPKAAESIDQAAIREIERGVRAGESAVPINAGAQLRAV